MKYVKEEYTNKEGKKVYIERFSGEKEQCLLANDDGFISPMVDHIEYDQEHDVFLVQDEFHDAYLDGTLGNNTANVFFYMDFEGNPLGLAYTDAFDGMFTPVIKDEENVDHDRWFIAYKEFKNTLGLELGRTIQKRTTHYKECAMKMLTVYQNK